MFSLARHPLSIIDISSPINHPQPLVPNARLLVMAGLPILKLLDSNIIS
jgi:hypothetical protein